MKDELFIAMLDKMPRQHIVEIDEGRFISDEVVASYDMEIDMPEMFTFHICDENEAEKIAYAELYLVDAHNKADYEIMDGETIDTGSVYEKIVRHPDYILYDHGNFCDDRFDYYDDRTLMPKFNMVIQTLYISEEYRGKGLAHVMFKMIEDIFMNEYGIALAFSGVFLNPFVEEIVNGEKKIIGYDYDKKMAEMRQHMKDVLIKNGYEEFEEDYFVKNHFYHHHNEM